MTIVESIELKRQNIVSKTTEFVKNKLPIIQRKVPDSVLSSPSMRLKVKFTRYKSGSVDLMFIIEDKKNRFELFNAGILYCSEIQQYEIMKEISKVIEKEGFKVINFRKHYLEVCLFNYTITAYIPTKKFNFYTIN